MREGLLDTNVFLHAQSTDEHSEECRRFLGALELGHRHARLEPLVLHELFYALRHYVKQMTREEIAEYLLMVLGWKGVRAETDLLVDTVERWRHTPRLAFVDAYLAARALRTQSPVFSKNVKELSAQGVDFPQPLPYATSARRS